MAPQVVGNLMTFSYLVGLTLGSLLSYWLDSLLGPPGSPCTGQEAQWTSRPGQHRCGPCFTPLYLHLPRFHSALGFHWSESFRPPNITY